MIRGVLIDLSGTLHHGNTVIPGAIHAMERLMNDKTNNNGIECIRFVTNTSTKSTTSLIHHLTETLGFRSNTGVTSNNLITSVIATKQYLQQNNYKKPFCLLEDTSDFEEQPQNSNNNNDDIDDNIDDYDCVIVGLAPTKFHYNKLNTAFRILLKNSNKQNNNDGDKNKNEERNDDDNNNKPRLIAIHRANYIRDTKDHELSLGPGAFITGLEVATNCTALVMGKPSNVFFQSAIQSMNARNNNDDSLSTIKENEICMIGDDIRQDIHGAQLAGIGKTILVKTGKYQPGDEHQRIQQASNDDNTLPVDGKPTLTCPSIVEAVDYILQHNKEVRQQRKQND